MEIRKAKQSDLSRVAEIYIFNNRINYLPIFKDECFSFGDLQVVSLVDNYFSKPDILNNLYVYDDGLIRGFIQINGKELCKIYVDTFFQGRKIGHQLINYCINELDIQYLWALEKNHRAIKFYQNHGFNLTGKKKYEEDTIEYLVHLKR